MKKSASPKGPQESILPIPMAGIEAPLAWDPASEASYIAALDLAKRAREQLCFFELRVAQAILEPHLIKHPEIASFQISYEQGYDDQASYWDEYRTRAQLADGSDPWDEPEGQAEADQVARDAMAEVRERAPLAWLRLVEKEISLASFKSGEFREVAARFESGVLAMSAARPERQGERVSL